MSAILAVLPASAVWAAEVPPTIQWQRSFGGSADDMLYNVQPTGDGGYVLGGVSNSGISGNKASPHYGGYDYWVLKLDSSGERVWERSFGGSGDDFVYGQGPQPTSDGGYILGGDSNSGISGNKTSPGYGGYDYWVLKLDANGETVWERSFGGSGDDRLASLQPTSDGGYILAGFSDSPTSSDKTSPNHGSSDYWVVKLDATGNKVWERSFGGASDEILHTVEQTADGGYILGGESTSSVSGNMTSTNYGTWDFWVVKLNANGNKVWENSYGGDSAEYLGAIQPLSAGGYLIGGSSQSWPSGNKTSPLYAGQFGSGPDYWVLKVNAQGSLLWDKSFGGDTVDFLFTVKQTTGGYLLCGLSASDVSGNKTTPNLGSYGSHDCWLVKTDLNGNKLWEASFGGAGSDWPYSLHRTSSGYVLGITSDSAVSGNKTTTNYGRFDFWIVKLEGPPVITAQPQARSVPVGDGVTFSATVVGASPLAYQWLFNGTSIADATGPTLTLTNTTHAHAGFYSVVVSNEFGVTTSARAQLLFNFLTLRMYAGLTIDGQTGQTYRIEYLHTLEGQADWKPLATVTLTNSPYLFIDREVPLSPQRFYRALFVPASGQH